MEKRIEYLIQRYLERNESDDELKELMELIASGAYRDLFESKFGKDLMGHISDTPFGGKKSVSYKLGSVRTGKAITTTQSFWIPMFQLAAVISIIIAVVFITIYKGRVDGEVHSDLVTAVSTSSEIKKIILDDGSIVWLKGQSTLTYPEKFETTSRDVSLTGEALFEVAKNSSWPFVIECGSLTTRVLGTSFNMKSDRKNTEILVLTGKVSVTPRGDKKAVYVSPNEKLIYNEESRMLARGSSDKSEVTASVHKTEYSMAFNDISMKDVAAKIEAKFNVKIRFDDERFSNCFVIGDFTDQSLEATLNMLSKLLDFQYEIGNNNLVKITGAGCERRRSL